ncbi:carbonyl reductase [NADPH] 1-like [Nymphalis io]|uniref:carbonyl reductase [NADPH] 1-like n=1 Tax=Inachis io TaxID=171585 RepID=UPI00216AA008|nr:carbonyl reductase [NADPH] 1-like [Nymphalis io]
MTDKIAIASGSKIGIGYDTVKELCKRGIVVVYLTARDFRKELQAVYKLKQEGLEPEFYKFDVSDARSVEEYALFIKYKHGGLDTIITGALLKYKARVVNISIDCEHISQLCNLKWQCILTNIDVQIQAMYSFVKWF